MQQRRKPSPNLPIYKKAILEAQMQGICFADFMPIWSSWPSWQRVSAASDWPMPVGGGTLYVRQFAKLVWSQFKEALKLCEGIAEAEEVLVDLGIRGSQCHEPVEHFFAASTFADSACKRQLLLNNILTPCSGRTANDVAFRKVK